MCTLDKSRCCAAFAGSSAAFSGITTDGTRSGISTAANRAGALCKECRVVCGSPSGVCCRYGSSRGGAGSGPVSRRLTSNGHPLEWLLPSEPGQQPRIDAAAPLPDGSGDTGVCGVGRAPLLYRLHPLGWALKSSPVLLTGTEDYSAAELPLSELSLCSDSGHMASFNFDLFTSSDSTLTCLD